MAETIQIEIPRDAVIGAITTSIAGAFQRDRWDTADPTAAIARATRAAVEREVVHVLASDEVRAAIRAALLTGIEAGARSVGEELGKRAAKVRAAIDAATRAGGEHG